MMELFTFMKVSSNSPRPDLNSFIDKYPSCRLALAMLLTGIFVLRFPDLLLHPQFWAEDGSVFFREAYCLGAKSLFLTYQGYYHLIPRLTALLSGFFAQTHAPALYCGTAISLTALVLYLTLSPRLSLPYKPLLALLIVIIPAGSEICGNITNIQWYLAVGLLVVFLMKPAESKIILGLEAVYVSAVAFTGPFALLLIPAMVLVLKANWSVTAARRRSILLTTAAAGISLVQLNSLLTHGISLPGIKSADNLRPLDYLTIIPDVTFLHIGMPYLRGINYIHPIIQDSVLSGSLCYFSYISLIAILLLYAASISGKKYLTEKYVIACFGLIVLFTGYYKIRYIFAAHNYLGSGHRYLFIPSLMLSWTFALMLRDSIIKHIAAVLLALLLITAVYDYRRAPFIDFKWPSLISRAEIDSRTRIPINPHGWSINMNCNEPDGGAPSIFFTR